MSYPQRVRTAQKAHCPTLAPCLVVPQDRFRARQGRRRRLIPDDRFPPFRRLCRFLDAFQRLTRMDFSTLPACNACIFFKYFRACTTCQYHAIMYHHLLNGSLDCNWQHRPRILQVRRKPRECATRTSRQDQEIDGVGRCSDLYNGIGSGSDDLLPLINGSLDDSVCKITRWY